MLPKGNWSTAQVARSPWSIRLMTTAGRSRTSPKKNGEMAERFNALPWKGSVRVNVPRVQIPLSPRVRKECICFSFVSEQVN